MTTNSRYLVSVTRVIPADRQRLFDVLADPALIGWKHIVGHVWRYRFTEVPGGTEVTEEWDARGTWKRLALVLLRFPQRNRPGMVATLERLEELVTRSE